MATVTAGMTVSLDGFVADRQGSATQLYPDLADLQGTDYMDAAIEETGTVVMGRRTFDMADPDSYVGNYEFQVPIFVVKTAAGDKVVQVVGGPSLIQQLLDAGLVDELWIDVMPVVLGNGVRLLENLDAERLRLEKLEVREVGARTSLGFRLVTR